MDPLLLICAAVIVVAIIGYITYLQKNKEPEDKPFRCNICGNRFANYNAFAAHKATHGAEDGEDGVRGAQRREGAAMAGGMRRTRQRRTMATARRQEDSDESGGEDSAEEAAKETIANMQGKVGKKKQQKILDKEEKKRQRELDAIEREEQKKREEEKRKQKEKDDAVKEAEEAAKEEVERQRKEEEERKEYEEYLKLKEQFSVEEEGTHELHMGMDAESLLQEFINYIKEMKVVMLEDLAAHFKLKTKEVIDRLNTLLEEERLTGVLDDRGKFIYITTQEYEAVAKFIRQRGRVSITELAESSNKLINLNPDNAETHKHLVEGKAC